MAHNWWGKAVVTKLVAQKLLGLHWCDRTGGTNLMARNWELVAQNMWSKTGSTKLVAQNWWDRTGGTKLAV